MRCRGDRCGDGPDKRGQWIQVNAGAMAAQTGEIGQCARTPSGSPYFRVGQSLDPSWGKRGNLFSPSLTPMFMGWICDSRKEVFLVKWGSLR